jgi:sulfate transport system permease protein
MGTATLQPSTGASLGTPMWTRDALPRLRAATEDRPWVRWACIGGTFAFLGLLLIVPLASIFAEAFRQGAGVYFASFTDPLCWSAIKLTLVAAGISVPLNLVFGLASAWAITKFNFRGKSFLISLIDLPFAISPVISGMIFVLIFGMQGWMGPWLKAHDVHILFAVPGIVLATVFVTFPFIARELIPLMQEQGSEEEQAAVSLGASGFQTFFRVTLPNARAMGEFGAVAVVSGHRRGHTNTLPLHIESLYNGYEFAAAFAVASLLALLGLVTLALKTAVEWKVQSDYEAAASG